MDTTADQLDSKIMQGTIRGERRRDGKRTKWEESIKDWTGATAAKMSNLWPPFHSWRPEER